MPILTFWVWTPSGASARAVLACPKGKKGAFSGAPEQVPKLSTISTTAQLGAAGLLTRRVGRFMGIGAAVQENRRAHKQS